ncbi:Acetyltransferase (GNAT) family protein [compost metagenome]
MTELNWRSMTPGDIDGVVAVARLSFPDHFEARECFAERQALAPEGCFVLSDKAGTVMGYLMAYPWKRDSAPPLDSLIGAVPRDAEVIYLHDLAVHPKTRGGGHTRAIVERLAEQARAAGWREIALVAVNAATAFWERHGFVVQNPPGMAEKLASYGGDARYMIRTL